MARAARASRSVRGGGVGDHIGPVARETRVPGAARPPSRTSILYFFLNVLKISFENIEQDD